MDNGSIDGWIFLAVNSLITVGVFLNGYRFARMTKNPWAGKSLLGQPIEGSEFPIERVRLLGRLQMIGAPVFLMLVAAMCFGLLGPVNGIETIQLGR